LFGVWLPPPPNNELVWVLGAPPKLKPELAPEVALEAPALEAPPPNIVLPEPAAEPPPNIEGDEVPLAGAPTFPKRLLVVPDVVVFLLAPKALPPDPKRPPLGVPPGVPLEGVPPKEKDMVLGWRDQGNGGTWVDGKKLDEESASDKKQGLGILQKGSKDPRKEKRSLN
jgi:hypothetical protein